MKEIGLAIQCNTCQTAGVLGPFGSDMAVSYYKLAVLVTYLFNDVETRRDQRKANAASTRSVLLRGGLWNEISWFPLFLGNLVFTIYG